ncbi:GntR family transcriptional regulator [uncultured Porphyromonas sp.]|uniref:GntR family transcriptional regulator n=1 Tax=uncultured Porphyromonas sp. TaxID=159274 RepID=UPI002631E7C7|nr:GntR family transcriptional regulator [uncultured Porphyromonas sp.]
MAYLNVGFTHIIDYITEGILSGKYQEEGRIPSVRDLAVLMQVAPNTVVHAYDKLAARELIYTQRGLGFFVTTGALERVRSQRRVLFLDETIPQIRREAKLIGITGEELREALDL